MALTLIKEDGSGSADANSYADAADGDAYHEGHCYATAWTGATQANKEKALVMATRLIDASYQFKGFRKSNDQALQWPREEAVDPDRRESRSSILTPRVGAFFESDEIPPILIAATCEMARELLVLDRTAAPDGEGLATFAVTGALSLTFNSSDRRPVISHLAQSMLAKLGTLISPSSGMARLVRT